MTIIYTQEDNWTGSYSLKRDGNICKIPFYYIGKNILRDEFMSKCLISWKLHQVDYRFDMKSGVYVKGVIQAKIAKTILWVKYKMYYRFFYLLYKLDLISDRNGEYFSWSKHFRPLRYLLEGGAEIKWR